MPSLQPLSHHEILGLVEPFTRRGQRIDLAASDRAARRLQFKPIEHPAAAPDLPPRREWLQLESLDGARFRLTRTLAAAGSFPITPLEATLEAEGDDPATLLAQIDAVPHQRQLRSGTGFLVARCHRIEWLPAARGRSAKVQRLVFASAAAVVDGFGLTLAMSRVTGIPAHLLLTANAAPDPSSNALPDELPDELPDDLLAVLGHSWARLIRVKDAWQGDLRLKGQMPERGDDAEAKFDITVAHLVQTLAEPPQRFHERQWRARWAVAARRTVPLLASLGLIAAAAWVPSLQLAQDSVLRMLIFHAPPLLLVGFFCMRELPRIELPRRPKPPRATAWRGPSLNDTAVR